MRRDPSPAHIISWPEGDLRTIHPRGELPVSSDHSCWATTIAGGARLVMSFSAKTHGIEQHDYRVDYPWWEKEYPDNFYQDC